MDYQITIMINTPQEQDQEIVEVTKNIQVTIEESIACLLDVGRTSYSIYLDETEV